MNFSFTQLDRSGVGRSPDALNASRLVRLSSPGTGQWHLLVNYAI